MQHLPAYEAVSLPAAGVEDWVTACDRRLFADLFHAENNLALQMEQVRD